MKAIIIDEPWISLILRGEKTWEMRLRAWRHQGPVALIRKRSGLVVGAADLAACLPMLDSLAAYAAAEPQHRIPPAEQKRAFSKGWRTPWVIENVRGLASPVPYKHKKGWMSVFDLKEQPDVVVAVLEQLR